MPAPTPAWNHVTSNAVPSSTSSPGPPEHLVFRVEFAGNNQVFSSLLLRWPRWVRLASPLSLSFLRAEESDFLLIEVA